MEMFLIPDACIFANARRVLTFSVVSKRCHKMFVWGLMKSLQSQFFVLNPWQLKLGVFYLVQ